MSTTRRKTVFIHTCQRCNRVWESDRKRPKVCPECKSYRWDTRVLRQPAK